MKHDIPFVFFGTPEFAVIVLEELYRVGLLPRLVVTAPDAPKGRGMETQPSPVKVWAEKRNIPVMTPPSLSDAATLEALKNVQAQLFVIAAYGYILSQRILDIPPRGVLNVHPSLLPKYRGATPIQGALLAGEKETGVTIMRTDAELDHGPIIAQRAYTIDPADDSATLTDALAHLGGMLAAETIPAWVDGAITDRAQDHSQATITRPLAKSDGHLDWSLTAQALLRCIRAYQSWPTSWCTIPTASGAVRVRILNAHAVDAGALRAEGTLISFLGKPCVACADGWIMLDRIRIAGKRDADGIALWSIAKEGTVLL